MEMRGFAEPLNLFKLHPLGTIAIFQVATLRNRCNFSCCTPWFHINSDPPPPPPPSPFIVGNYIFIIYIFIGVNGNEGVCRTFATFQVAPLKNHCNFSSCNPWEPLQFFMLHPLVSYKFRPPPPPHLQKLTFFHVFEKFRHCIFLSPLKFFESCDSLRSLRSKFTGV